MRDLTVLYINYKALKISENQYLDAVKSSLKEHNILLNSKQLRSLSANLSNTSTEEVLDFSHKNLMTKTKNAIKFKANKFFSKILYHMPREAEKKMIQELIHIKSLIEIYAKDPSNESIKKELEIYKEKIMWYSAKYILGNKKNKFEDKRLSANFSTLLKDIFKDKAPLLNKIFGEKSVVNAPQKQGHKFEGHIERKAP